MKRFSLVIYLLLATSILFAQEVESKKEKKQAKKEEKRQRTNALIRQEEEGVLAYNKQTVMLRLSNWAE